MTISIRSRNPFIRLIAGLFFISLLLFAVGCSNDGTSISTGENDSETRDELHDMEQEVHLQINEYRQSQFLSTLRWSETIADYCRTHSLDMAAGRVAFGHSGFETRIEGIGQTLFYESAAENVAYNNYADPASTAVQGWLMSPGHLANIQGDFDLTGIGVAMSDDGLYYFTQIFIRQ
ncbi:MAG: CAP domain-containing protein [Desulfobacteraceae bacterium]|nr:MAG: CAP domain-containing protein [Desulfobacteraceae bacterium]